MAEYLEKEGLKKSITSLLAIEGITPDIEQLVIAIIDGEMLADVQPISQWISVKDRLPDEDGWYLVCKHNRVRVAEWCKDCWYNESDLPIDDCAITYWQPLPELPKDGNVK